MNSKIILLSVAVVAVGLFALPSTMSLFSGQHTWYNVDEIKCQKCHQDIYDELNGGANQAHTSVEMKNCEQCHRTANYSSGNLSGANISKGQWNQYNSTGALIGSVSVTAHAAVTVECLACHGLDNATSGQTKGITAVAAELQGSAEAHKTFYYASVSDKDIGDINQTSLASAGINKGPTWYATTGNQTAIKLKGTNTACIGCHTHAIVNITWTRSTGYGMVVEAETSTGKLNITSWSINSSTKVTNTSNE